MPRTTIDIEAPILKELKLLRKRERRALGKIVSHLLAEALARRKAASSAPPSFTWTAQDMKALVDLSDKEALCAVLDKGKA
ncbi:MAG: antitoxin [Nitrospirae bacterium]|nr:antitoxin [Nitrospirota bacterium]